MVSRKRKSARGVAEPVGLYDAKTRLSELVDEAAAGREFTIMKSGKPMARLVPLTPPDARALRKPGGGKGRVWMASDFDAPLAPEVMRLFTGEHE
jgi:prevent-host-death family protein